MIEMCVVYPQDMTLKEMIDDLEIKGSKGISRIIRNKGNPEVCYLVEE